MAIHRHVIPRYRLIASGTLTVLNWVFTIAYRFPDVLVKKAFVPGQIRVSIVTYIDGLGPVWAMAFLLAAIGMTFSLITRRWVIVGHTLGGMVWAAYSTALLFGVFASKPIGSIISAAMAVAICFFHVSLVDAYSGELVIRKEPENER